nr:hypothetical protein GCM10025730_50400 [Promicromonospora thailandica]
MSNDIADRTTPTDQAALLDILRAQAGTTEHDERPTPDTLAALRALGTLALRTPRAHGGAEADATTVARRLTEVGRACPTSSWVAGTCLTAKNIAAYSFPQATVAEVFADPDALFCGSGFPGGHGERVPGGVRVTGSWPSVSGCEDAVWATLGVLVDGVLTFVVVPLDDLTVERTWHMAGMRGTGSHTVVAQDLFVRDDHTAGKAPFGPADRLLYAIAVLAPVVGAAQGALDATTEMFASGRKPYMSAYTRMGDSPRRGTGSPRRRTWCTAPRPRCSPSPPGRTPRRLLPGRTPWTAPTGTTSAWPSRTPPATAGRPWSSCST